MAASLRNVGRLFLQDKRLINAIFVRNARYDTSYVDNTRTLESLEQPLDKHDLRRFRKIKAARTEDNTFTDFDPVIQKFTNMLMECGKKSTARELVQRALENIKRAQVERYHTSDDEKKPTLELNPVVIFHQALENGAPSLVIKKVAKGDQTYQVPVSPSEARQKFLSMKWLIAAAHDKPRYERFHKKLGEEILNAFYNKGGLIKRKQDMHKLCENNKAFAHLAGFN